MTPDVFLFSKPHNKIGRDGNDNKIATVPTPEKPRINGPDPARIKRISEDEKHHIRRDGKR